jgi:hypothetical protein
MKTSQGLGILTMGLMLLSSVGCMVSPGNQEVFASRSTPIQFSGFTVHPGQHVEIFARDNSTQSWVKIGQTTSTSDAFEHFGSNWYFWKKEIVVPKSLWQKWGNDGSYSVVLKGVADKNDLMTFKEGFYNYYEDYDSLEELYLENKSTSGIEILVWAEQ